jgi:hypothetical protein
MAKKRTDVDPELKKLYAENRRWMVARVQQLTAEIDARSEREERRRARLRRLTFGLLGRS